MHRGVCDVLFGTLPIDVSRLGALRKCHVTIIVAPNRAQMGAMAAQASRLEVGGHAPNEAMCCRKPCAPHVSLALVEDQGHKIVHPELVSKCVCVCVLVLHEHDKNKLSLLSLLSLLKCGQQIQHPLCTTLRLQAELTLGGRERWGTQGAF